MTLRKSTAQFAASKQFTKVNVNNSGQAQVTRVESVLVGWPKEVIVKEMRARSQQKFAHPLPTLMKKPA